VNLLVSESSQWLLDWYFQWRILLFSLKILKGISPDYQPKKKIAEIWLNYLNRTIRTGKVIRIKCKNLRCRRLYRFLSVIASRLIKDGDQIRENCVFFLLIALSPFNKKIPFDWRIIRIRGGEHDRRTNSNLDVIFCALHLISLMLRIILFESREPEMDNGGYGRTEN
jgi:hypothetical protein